MRKRFLIITATGLIVGLAGAFGLYWLWAADQLADSLSLWAEQQRGRGYQITYQEPAITGFPLRLAVRLEQPQVVAPNNWRWSGPAIHGEAALWDPFSIRVQFPGAHQIIRAAERIEINAGAAQANIHLRRDGQIDNATVTLSEARVAAELPVTLNRPKQVFTAERLEIKLGPLRPPQGARQQELDLAAVATNVALPKAMSEPFGDTLAQMDFAATLVGPLPSGPLSESLPRWRDAGGSLDLHRVTMLWGALNLEAEGAVTLDEVLRPRGKLAARLQRPDRAVDALARRGLIKSDRVLGIKIVLAALANDADAAGAPRIKLPITLRDGLLYLGPVAIARLSPVL